MNTCSCMGMLLLFECMVSRMLTSHNWCWVLRRVGGSFELVGGVFPAVDEMEGEGEEGSPFVVAVVDFDWLLGIVTSGALFDWMHRMVDSSDWLRRTAERLPRLQDTATSDWSQSIELTRKIEFVSDRTRLEAWKAVVVVVVAEEQRMNRPVVVMAGSDTAKEATGHATQPRGLRLASHLACCRSH